MVLPVLAATHESLLVIVLFQLAVIILAAVAAIVRSQYAVFLMPRMVNLTLGSALVMILGIRPVLRWWIGRALQRGGGELGLNAPAILLIVINVRYDLRVIPRSVFCMLVMMALLTTFMTTPLPHLFKRGTEFEEPMAALSPGRRCIAVVA